MNNSDSFPVQHFILNGKLKPLIEFSDSMVTGEKIIYEVIRVMDSTPIFLEEHLKRMEQSITLSNLELIDIELLHKSVKELLANNPVKQHNIKVVANYKSPNTKPVFLVFFIPSKYPSTLQQNNGVWVKTIPATRLNPEVKAENKILRNYADEIIANYKCYEVLMINDSGLITEGSRSNVFFVKQGKLLTAPLNLVLGGITRLKILEICKELGIEVSLECLHKSKLNCIDGGFITGTSPGVLLINKIDNIDIDINVDIIQRIHDAYDNLVNNEIKRWKHKN